MKLAALLVLGLCVAARGAITVEAYYQLGDADPGAGAGNVGDAQTVDSGPNGFDLTRHGQPQYSSDVPPLASATAAADTLSMRFVNPSSPIDITRAGGVEGSFYSRLSVLATPASNYGLEAWVKPSALTPADASGYALIAYNGSPFLASLGAASNGVGFFEKGGNYIVRIGDTEKILAPVVPNQWTHLVFLRGATANDFYVGNAEVPDLSSDAQTRPIAPTGSFYIGGYPTAALHGDLFNGTIDDVRFFTYSTTGPQPFDPETDLLMAVPEPGMLGIAMGAVLFIRRRR
ncbi:MAG TPA: LamG domain-containing protein [Tepidisphaeraceae bacterium]|jgi:hypothetical protein|nr:LamG domain-containing protein [Tepidisphaeraceae bacterium]